MTGVNQALNQCVHLRDMPGSARLIRGRGNAQRLISLRKNLFKTIGKRPPLLPRNLTLKALLKGTDGVRKDFIVNIGNITHRSNL